MACVADYPFHWQAEEQPIKRRRLNSLWDVLPGHEQAKQTLVFAGQGAGNGNGNGVALPHKTSSSSSSSFRNESPPWRDDDKDGHYMFELGDNLTPRYKIIRKMGEGTFGQVVECWDRHSREFVAIKIVRGLEKYREAAMIEIDVLCEVGKNDKRGGRLKYFFFKNLQRCKAHIHVEFLIRAFPFALMESNRDYHAHLT